MIPYDDLVVALAAWRARQGLPVAQLAVTPPPAPPRPPAQAAARATAPRAAPPPPPPASSSQDDFDDGGLVEDGQYASAGDDYVVPLGGDMVEQAGESTAIGAAPEPPSEGLTKRGKRNPDW
jgi:hypothetical protein